MRVLAENSTTIAPLDGWSLFLLMIAFLVFCAIAGEIAGRRRRD